MAGVAFVRAIVRVVAVRQMPDYMPVCLKETNIFAYQRFITFDC